ITRLTQSGLSMVEWAPIMGVIPPIGDAALNRVFELYRLSPEYLKVNAGMSLDEFKFIFWWEYGHRVLGRFIGLIYFLPLLFFYFKGWIPRGWHLKLLLLFVLGGMQGLMGWYMVQSGLVDIPQVSQYRLTAHLGLAFIIYTLLFWFALDFLRGERPHRQASPAYLKTTAIALLLVFLMVLTGGFVAGTKAGHIMNTYPLMAGTLIPDGVLAMQPLWRNFFENAITIQFVHRWFAVVVALAIIACFYVARTQRFTTYTFWMLIALVLQFTLGVAALLWKVPLALGALHQACAVLLLSSLIMVVHVARKENQSTTI
ncbi:MAG: COX15/CtaA family protein, partial [Pseudomonadota bacterium]